MACSYKGVGSGGGWAAGGRLYRPLGLFRLIMSPRSASYMSRQARGISLTLESISDSCLPYSALHEPIVHCDLTWLANSF